MFWGNRRQMSGMVREKFRFRKGRCARLRDYFSFSEKTLPCFARKSNDCGGASVLAHVSFFLRCNSFCCVSAAQEPKMMSGMCRVNCEDLVTRHSAECGMRSEFAGVIDQTLDTGRECFHLSCIVQAVRRHEHRSGPDTAR